MATRTVECRVGKVKESGQNSRYKINKPCIVYLKVVKIVDSKISYHKKIVTICGNGY